METFQAAVRMSNMYWDVCESEISASGMGNELSERSGFRSFDLVPDLIDWSNAAGKTALHMACQSGNTELVRVSPRSV